MNALKNKGALPWVNPNEIQGFLDVFYPTDFLHTNNSKCESPVQMSLLDMTSLQNESGIVDKANFVKDHSIQIQESDSFVGSKPNDLLFIYVSKLIRNLTLSFSKKDCELAAELGISISQMRIWLKRLVDEKSMIKENRPIKYRWKKS